MVKRDEARTRGQLLRAELNETFDHALRAAGHAAGGVSAAVRPRVDAVRGRMAPTAGKVRDTASRRWSSTREAFVPLSEAAQAKVADAKKDAKQATRRKRRGGTAARRWPVVAGIVAAGAVVGALGAVLLRLRKQRWDGYQPEEPVATDPERPADLAAERTAAERTAFEGTAAEGTAEGTPPEGLAPPDWSRETAVGRGVNARSRQG